MKKVKAKTIIKRCVQLAICFCLLYAIALQLKTAPVPAAERSDEVVVDKAKGYGGPVPLKLTIVNDTIAGVELLANNETPDFIEYVVGTGLLERRCGLPLEAAAELEVAAVSGATDSSTAIIRNVREAALQAADSQTRPKTTIANSQTRDYGVMVAALVLLAGIIIPLFYKSRVYRYIQLAANLIVLGLWTGTFLSLQFLVSLVGQGLPSVADYGLWRVVITMLLIIVAVLFPLFGKRQHYCTWLCPLGSCQELLSKTTKRKLHLSPKLVKALDIFRQVLWLVIMLTMWLGLTFDWLGWELFTAFLFQQAPTALLIIAIIILILSCFVTRPYCRFVCPTGTLLKFMEL